MMIEGLRAEITGKEHVIHTVELSFEGRVVLTSFEAENSIDVFSFLVIWLDCMVPTYYPWYSKEQNAKVYEHSRKCREEAIYLFGSEKSLHEYDAKIRRLRGASSLS